MCRTPGLNDCRTIATQARSICGGDAMEAVLVTGVGLVLGVASWLSDKDLEDD